MTYTRRFMSVLAAGAAVAAVASTATSSAASTTPQFSLAAESKAMTGVTYNPLAPIGTAAHPLELVPQAVANKISAGSVNVADVADNCLSWADTPDQIKAPQWKTQGYLYIRSTRWAECSPRPLPVVMCSQLRHWYINKWVVDDDSVRCGAWGPPSYRDGMLVLHECYSTTKVWTYAAFGWSEVYGWDNIPDWLYFVPTPPNPASNQAINGAVNMESATLSFGAVC